MLSSALFLFAIVLAGFGIAILADNLGRKLGKKRLSLGKLRPRHVATLSTGIVGALISMLTIGLVSLASQDVRRWIIEGQQAIRDVERLRAQESSLQEQIEDLDRRLAELNDVIATKTSQEQEATRRLRESTLRLQEFRTRLEEATLKTRSLQSQTSKLTSSLSSLQRNVRLQGAQLFQAKESLKATQLNETQARLALARADREYEELLKNRDALDKELAALEKTADDRADEVAKITEERNVLSQDFELAKQRYDQVREAYDRDLVALRKDLVDAQTELTRQRTLLNEVGSLLQQNANNSRLNPMIFRYQQELARTSIQPSRNLAESREIVQSLILRCQQIARNKGAREDVAAGLYDLLDNNGAVVATVDQQLERWTRLIAGKADDAVLIARARVNSFAGEFVSLELGLFRNPLIYRSGQVVAESRIDGRGDQQNILRQLEEFLQVDVRDRAKRDGMIPLQGETGETVGTVTPQVLLDLVNSIRSEQRIVRVQARARGDIRAADELDLQFVFR